MTRRLASVVVLLASALMLAALAPIHTRDPVPLTVHEWGTFTSVAGPDGRAAVWQPLSGPQDLPCFVERIRVNLKPDLSGTVRMETPVLYFYAPEDTSANVSVSFPQGFVTEWFPRAAVTPATVHVLALRDPNLVSTISWKNVKVSPRGAADFPAELSPSHYYAARDTDASPLQVGSQKERFLFYRGVGRFAPPITARVDGDGKIHVTNPGGEAIGDVIVFENRGGAIGYQVTHAAQAALTLEGSLPTAPLSSLHDDLRGILIARGLYPKEASAMVETWRDSWFEEGTRLFYIPSKNAIDSILPLAVSPTPTAVARVFVGRVELITPRTLQDVKDGVLRADGSALRQWGRFLPLIISRIGDETLPAERAAWESRVTAAYASLYAAAPAGVTCR